MPTHRYQDPLDQVWLATAENIGLQVQRSDQVYAHCADGTLYLGTAETLDPDDCLAQMVLHEFCHAMIEGPESLKAEDWGVDNTSPKDLVREHATLRLQAKLASRFGLRDFLGATTVFRVYYDALPKDPLGGADDPAIGLAARGLARSESAPFAPHILRALEATQRIVFAAAAFSSSKPQGQLPNMYRLVSSVNMDAADDPAHEPG